MTIEEWPKACNLASFENGGRGHKPRNVAGSRSWKRQEIDSLLEPPEMIDPLA